MPLPLISKIAMKRGAGATSANDQAVLDALWNIAVDGVVAREQIEWQLKILALPIDRLRKFCCLDYTIGPRGKGARGVQRIFLKAHVVPAVPSKKEKKKPAIHTKTQTPLSPPPLATPGTFVREGDEIKFAQEVLRREKQRRAQHKAFVYVDEANFTGLRLSRVFGQTEAGPGAYDQKRIMRTGDVNWGALRKVLEKGPGNITIPVLSPDCLQIFLNAGIYKGSARDAAEVSMKCAGFSIRHFLKNVDEDILVTMMGQVRNALDECSEVVVILVSGDVGYARAFEILAEDAKRLGCVLRVWVISWRQQLSHILRAVAQYYTPIESFLALVAPQGSDMLRTAQWEAQRLAAE